MRSHVCRHVLYVCEFMWRPEAEAENQPLPLVLELLDTDQLVELGWVSPVQSIPSLPEYTLLMGNPGHATVPFYKTRHSVNLFTTLLCG